MKDAFGVDRTDISKAWKGEPGDKRNTKYAAAYGVSPVFAGVPYTIYRQTKTGKKNRAESIKAKKRVSKSDNQRVAAGTGGAIAGLGATGAAIAAGAHHANVRAAERGVRRSNSNVNWAKGEAKDTKKRLRSSQANLYSRSDKYGNPVSARRRLSDLEDDLKQHKENKKWVKNFKKTGDKWRGIESDSRALRGRNLKVAGGLAAISAGGIVAANTIPKSKVTQ